MVLGVLMGVMYFTGRETDPHGALFLGTAAPIMFLVGASIWTIGYARRATSRDRRYF
jgi:hypothetical protein